MDEHQNFNECTITLADSGGRALGGLITKIKKFKSLCFGTYTKLYDSCVASILDFGSEIWGLKTFNVCELIQNRAIRYFMGVHKYVPTSAIQADFGWLGSKERRRLNAIKLWNRLIEMEDSRLTKKLFYKNNQHNLSWSKNIGEVVEHLGMNNNHVNLEVCNLRQCKERLREQQNEELLTEINNKPKLRLYKEFKMKSNTEEYLLHYINKSKRSLFAQLRCGILPLIIETGRFKIKKDEINGT